MKRIFSSSALALLFAALLGMLMGPGAPAQAQDFAQIVPKLDRSVARVMNIQNGRFHSHGSGFIFGAQGNRVLLLTNHHVIDGGDEFLVGFQVDGQAQIYSASVISQSTVVDLAVLSLQPNDDGFHSHQPLPVAVGEQARGKAVAAVGYPGLSDDITTDGIRNPSFFESTMTTGNVSRVATGTFLGGGEFEILQHTAAVNPGNSGGPLIDPCGTVLGVNTLVPTLRAGGGTVPAGTFWSSSNRTISTFLEQKAGVQFGTKSGPCTASNQTPDNSGGGGGGSSGGDDGANNRGGGDTNSGDRRLFILVALLAGAALFAGIFLYMGQKGKAVGGGGKSSGGASGGPAKPILTLHAAGSAKPLTEAALKRGVTIGRDPSAGITLSVKELSRKHARLSLVDRKLMIEDLSSSNGTFVDGKKLTPGTKVQINTSSKVVLAETPLDLRRS